MNHFWVQAGLVQESFWQMILVESIFATVLFGLVFLLTRFGRIRSPQLRYGLWSLVWIRLLLPPGFGFPLSLTALLARWMPADPGALVVSQPMVKSTGPHTDAGPVEFLVHQSAGEIGWAFTVAWVIGSLWFWWASLRNRAHYRASLKTALPVDDPLIKGIFNRWRAQFRIRKPVGLFRAQSPQSPFTMGWRRPKIFLPEAVIAQGVDVLEVVIAHELAHIKRGDDLWLRLLNLVRAAYFFHPAAWVSIRQCNHERERLCDHMVMQTGAITAKRYGGGLLVVLRLQLQPARGMAALGPRARQIESRLRSLGSYKKNPVKPLWITALMVGLGLFLLPMATVPASNQEPGDVQGAADQPNGFLHPLPSGRLTSEFGLRRTPFSEQKQHHRGIDLAAPLGQPVRAPADGVVTEATTQYHKGKTYGTVVIIDHGQQRQSFFSHLHSLAVTKGQRVERGTPIGTVGNTGQSTAPHLHFEIWLEGEAVDPLPLIEGPRDQ